MLRAIERYHELLAGDPAAASEQAQGLRAAFEREGVRFGSQPMSSVLRPALISRADWDALRGCSARVAQVAERVARQAFDGDVRRLCAFLGMPEDEGAWVELDPGPADVVSARLDALLGADGPRFIEINTDAPVGFGYGDRMARIFRELPALATVAREFPIAYEGAGETLVRALGAQWRLSGGHGRPRVAIAEWEESDTRAHLELLRETFAVRGFDCVVADPRTMEVHRGRLHAGGAPVDLVYRRVELRELVGREIEVQSFMGAYRHRLCPFVNSFRCRLSEDKGLLAILTDEAFAHLLSADERELVSRVLPWTRRLEERRTRKNGMDVDLVPYVLANRESLVLKPAHEYGGREVVVGADVGWADWDLAVRSALGGAWVVQEHVNVPEQPFPVVEGGTLEFVAMKLNVAPFYVAGESAGAVARVSRRSVVNVSAGGSSVPVFVVG